MSFNRDFAARLAVGLGGGLFFVGLAWYGRYGLAISLGILTIVALKEFFGLINRGGGRALPVLGYALAAAFFVIAVRPGARLDDLHIAIAATVIVLALMKIIQGRPGDKPALATVMITVFGTLYIAGSCSTALNLHSIFESHFKSMSVKYDTLLLLPCVGAWASDTGAYLSGRIVGRDRLTRISPNKTVEGVVGGVFAGFTAVFIFGNFLHLAMPVTLLLGVILPFLGLAGDLFESGMKRRFDAKDSGSFFKAHGGVLDRLDSFFFVLPVTYIVIYYFYIYKGN